MERNRKTVMNYIDEGYIGGYIGGYIANEIERRD